jgi:uncharacterized membrane protein YdjX (TVP38/TMEM64 family)
MTKQKTSLIFFGVIIVLSLIAYFSGVGHYLSIDELKKQRAVLEQFVQSHPALSPLVYILIYAVAVSLSLPGGTFLTIIGGFLFMQPWGTIFAVCGATIGAICLFLIAKSALGGVLKEKAGPFLNKFADGFQQNAASYMLFLRLVPLFPFWAVNLAPAFLGVSFSTYAWTTAIGILPGAFALAQAGVALGTILDSNEPFSIAGVFNIQMRIALIALGILALLPVLIKKLKK